MKVLVLILASDSDNYNQFQELWRKYMNLDKDFECYFIKANPNISEDVIQINDTIYVKTLELYENIFYKTQKAFQYFNSRLNEFDYIFRTNLSSCIIFSKYKKWLNTQPKENLYNGSILWAGPYIYASGCGFTCSPDVIRIFNNTTTQQIYLDDVTFGKICMDNNIKVSSAPLNNINLMNLEEELQWFNSYDCSFHFRLKSDDRSQDIQMYKLLLGLFYQIF
jgi:hypothetical protein